MPPLLLVINDDRIASPGLAATAAALDLQGGAAGSDASVPAKQQGPQPFTGRRPRRKPDCATVTYGELSWPGVSAPTTRALAVEHGVLELASLPVDLVVSGINYGENVSTCASISGTNPAVLEAAEWDVQQTLRGVPSAWPRQCTSVSRC